MKRVILTGASGQLGKTLKDITPTSIELFTPTREDLNLAMLSEFRTYIEKINPDWIINAGAYTNVEKAQSEIKEAFDVNGKAPKIFNDYLSSNKGRLMQISTDYVFDGEKNNPYTPLDKCNPINIYGESKLMGEIEALKLKKNIVIRTSWLYSQYGKNFVKTMLKLHKLRSISKEPLKVINDQIGCPTSCLSLASFCWKIIASDKLFEQNIFHFCDAGVASWYDFAYAIGELAKQKSIIDDMAIVEPTKSENFITEARRPRFSLMNSEESYSKFLINYKHWRLSLSEVLDQIKHGSCSSL